MNDYVQMLDGAYRVTGSRVSLDSVVYSFWQGDSPETIAQNFPTLTLAQVYGALAFYLSRQDEVDAYLKAGEAEYEQARQAARAERPAFYQDLRRRLEKAKTQREQAVLA
jgi:uncharacterized protein (DUF433 family)